MNGISMKMAAKVAIGLMIAMGLAVAGMASDSVTGFDVFQVDLASDIAGSDAGDDASDDLESLPDLPGLEADDLGPNILMEFGASRAPRFPRVTMDWPGLHSLGLNGKLYLIVSGINPNGYTTVRWAERYPNGQWWIFDFSGWYPTGKLPLTFIGDTVGRHVVLIWADNNGNGLVDRGEVTDPWMEVDVVRRNFIFRITSRP